jgi:hypothetical protein
MLFEPTAVPYVGKDMIDIATIRRLALALPETEDLSDARALRFAVRGKGFAWTYMERLAPKVPRRPRRDVLAVRCALEMKEMLIDAAPDRFFDDDHYRGYPAVLVRLEAIDKAELASLLRDAWRLIAPKSLARSHDSESWSR